MASDIAILEALPDAALLLSGDDRIVAVNARACALVRRDVPPTASAG